MSPSSENLLNGAIIDLVTRVPSRFIKRGRLHVAQCGDTTKLTARHRALFFRRRMLADSIHRILGTLYGVAFVLLSFFWFGIVLPFIHNAAGCAATLKLSLLGQILR